MFLRVVCLVAAVACSLPSAEGFSAGGPLHLSRSGGNSYGISMLSSPARILNGANPLSLSSASPARGQLQKPVGRSSLANLATDTGFGGGSGKGIVRGGGGGGGGGDGNGEDEDAKIAALLKQYGLLASQLPKGAEALGSAQLKRFLDAYKNAVSQPSPKRKKKVYAHALIIQTGKFDTRTPFSLIGS
jgi:hypothetical protein